MKITFDGLNVQEMNRSTSLSSEKQTVSISKTEKSVFVGKSLNDNKTYEGHGMTKADLQSEMSKKNIQIAQNYMTVMSNSMSEEDFAEMVRSGERPASIEPEESVTILDRIKLAVAQGGTEVEGFTDTLDSETIEAMIGRKTITSDISVDSYDVSISPDTMDKVVEAYKELSEIDGISEGMKKYFATTNESLTIDNLYLSKHSVAYDAFEQGSNYFSVGAEGYYAKKATNSDVSELRGEVEKLLENIGYPVNEESVKDGLWLVDNSLCIDSDKLNKLKEINSIDFPITDIEFARSVLTALSEGKEPKDAVIGKTVSDYSEAARLTRAVLETQVKMTAEANLMLLKSGYKIDTSEIEKYIEALKQAEGTKEVKELEAITDTEETIEEIRRLPSAVIGVVAARIEDISLLDIRDTGRSKIDYAMVEARYESVGTNVRADYGDSIKKAFRNIDALLENIEVAPTDENRRATRILGYNSMPVTKENVERIRRADEEIQKVLNRLTPEDTLRLIRKGSSPINMSIKELNEYLDSKTEVQFEEIEKYSKFLYRLDAHKEIGEEERKEYIEVYRFIHSLEKNDMAAVGSVVNAGQELTLGNLKTAIKTGKHRGMDIKVDTSYGMMLQDIREEMIVRISDGIEFSDASSLDYLYEKLANAPIDYEAENAYIHEQYEDVRKALNAPNEVVETLVNNSVPATAENLEAAFALIKRKGDAFTKAKDTKNEHFIEAEEGLIDRMGDETATEAAYEDMVEAGKTALYEEAMKQVSYLDVKALKLAHMQLSLAGKLAMNESYELPVEISGRLANVTLKVVHNESEQANVMITLEDDEIGMVAARLYDEDGINGFIACNLSETVTKMQKVADIFGNKVSTVLSEKPYTDERLSRISTKENSKNVPTARLYEATKKFLSALKGL